MSTFEHWCGNCQIRIYFRRHYNYDIDWQDCPYTCEYAATMRKSCSISVDTEPAKHGQWILSEDRYWKTCSECGAKVDVSMGLGIFVDDIEVDEMNYCPNCGAKMDEDEVGE